MNELLAGHENLLIHAIGWLLAGAGAMVTMLYKGIWKSINILREEHEELRSEFDRLIGEHKVRHPASPPWDGVDRRKEPR